MSRENAEAVVRLGPKGRPLPQASERGASTPVARMQERSAEIAEAQSHEVDLVTLTRLSDAVDHLREMVGRLMNRGDEGCGRPEQVPEATSLSHAIRPARGAVPIPLPGQRVAWKAHFRADVPQYVADQLKAEAYVSGRTAVSVVLQVMSAFRDDDGCPVFHIRDEDMIADRRKTSRPENRKSNKNISRQ